MTGREYADLVASYVSQRFAARGLRVYREVQVGKSIIGKNRRIDVRCVCETSSWARGNVSRYSKVRSVRLQLDE